VTFQTIAGQKLLHKNALNPYVYAGDDICLIPSTSEDICEAVHEKLSRMQYSWMEDEQDAKEQERFVLFSTHIIDADVNNKLMHSDIWGRIGADFLRSSRGWV